MRWGLIGLLVALAAPATARDLAVPADKGWQHAATGLILRPTLLGLPRTRLSDNSAAEYDVSAQFNDPALETSATVYLFHAALPSVPVWFDRAEYQLMHREHHSPAKPAREASAFAPPGAGVAAGLSRTYRPDSGPYKGEALAVMPLGDWLVAIRLSSATLEPEAIDVAMSSLIAQIGWPRTAPAPTVAAVPVGPCPNRIATHRATIKAPDMMQMILGSAIASAAAKHKDDAPAKPVQPWCRDGDGEIAYAMYRVPDSPGYMLALADSGRSINVYAGFTLPNEPSTGGYSVVLADIDGSSATFPSFDALPRPNQVVELVTRSAPTSRVVPGADGKTMVNINAGMIKK